MLNNVTILVKIWLRLLSIKKFKRGKFNYSNKIELDIPKLLNTLDKIIKSKIFNFVINNFVTFRRETNGVSLLQIFIENINNLKN